MIIRMGLLTRRPDLTPVAFRAYWRDVHGPLAAELPGLLAYHQNPVVDAAQRGIDHARGAWTFDGLSQLWFADVAAMRAAIASGRYDAVAADSPGFVADTKVVAAEPHVVVPLPSDPVPCIKRMSILTRLPGMSAEEFSREWREVHGTLVRRFPHLLGYTQNHVVIRESAPGIAATHAALPIDGVVEMWFRDLDGLGAAFASEAGVAAMAHAQRFIAEITTFLVEPHVVR